MYRKLIHALYCLNMLFQSLFSLAAPIALMTLVAWLLCRYTTVGSWVYVPAILVGVAVGLSSMIRFLLTASAAIRNLEKEGEERDRQTQKKKNKTNTKGGTSDE